MLFHKKSKKRITDKAGELKANTRVSGSYCSCAADSLHSYQTQEQCPQSPKTHNPQLSETKCVQPIRPHCPPSSCGSQCTCPKPPCPCPADSVGIPDFYAQYGVTANPETGSKVPFLQLFNEGSQIILEDASTILLPQGYLYLIDYVFLATPEANSYMQIVPELNGILKPLYSFFAPTGQAGNTSAAGSFTTVEASAGPLRLSFVLTYSQVVRNIDLSGAVSVTPLRKI